MATLIQPSTDSTGRRVAIVAARFNAEITEALLAGALQKLEAAGVDQQNIEVARVAGAFELPLACHRAAASKRFDAVLALGCVIRGETPHFDFVAGEAARGCMQSGLDTGVPVIFGVLTTDTLAQARHRADPSIQTSSHPDLEGKQVKITPASNKGAEAAEVALEMAALLEQLS